MIAGPDATPLVHTLHARFTLAIPSLNAVLAIDDVETDGKRIDDFGREPPLFLDLHRALDDFTLEATRVLGGAQRRRKHVGHDIEEDALVGIERVSAPENESAKHSMPRQQTHRGEAAI